LDGFSESRHTFTYLSSLKSLGLFIKYFLKVTNMNWMLTLRILRKMRCEKIPVRLGQNVFLHSPRAKKREGWTILLKENLFKEFSEDIRRIGDILNFDVQLLCKNNRDYIEIIESTILESELNNIEISSDIVV